RGRRTAASGAPRHRTEARRVMRRPRGVLSGCGLVLGLAVIGWAHMSMGGDVRLFLQPEAVAVVFGGTMAALLVSFSGRTLRATLRRILRLSLRRGPPPPPR